MRPVKDPLPDGAFSQLGAPLRMLLPRPCDPRVCRRSLTGTRRGIIRRAPWWEMFDLGRLIETDGHEDRECAVSVWVTDGQWRDRIIQTERELATVPERL